MNTSAAKTTDQVDEDQIEEDSGEFEIEIVDDVPDEDKPRRAENDTAPPVAESDDLESYSESVQKRIKKLTFEAREEKRQREAASREREEAINYAKTVYEQNKRLQEQLSEGQSAVVQQATGRVQTELESARAAYKAAYELGDSDKLLDAQSKLIELQGRLSQLQNYRPAPKAREEEFTPVSKPKVETQPQVQLNDRQKSWMDNNSWYGENSEMTGFALGVHERLVRNGVDPNSETYYTEIDTAVRKRFSDEFPDALETEVTPAQRKAANVVAPAGRSTPTPRRVKLTSTQVAIAKRLGVTPEQYAAQLLKDAKNG
jgi:hypothetical protein